MGMYKALLAVLEFANEIDIGLMNICIGFKHE
jgi:hypothetical protein